MKLKLVLNIYAILNSGNKPRLTAPCYLCKSFRGRGKDKKYYCKEYKEDIKDWNHELIFEYTNGSDQGCQYFRYRTNAKRRIL